VNPRSLSLAALAVLLLVAVPALAAPPSVPPGHARPGRFQVIKKYADGPWLVPTLKAMRSPEAWNLQMTRWLADQAVVGREDPPAINWNQQAVIVLSLGSQMGQCGVDVNHCMVEADTTLFDLHFITPPQWDPNGSIEHPAVLIAVDRSDLKNLKVQFDCEINGLPNRQDRRSYGFDVNSSDVPTVDAVEASSEANTTWGRVKDSYR
jgi:hypothetical protein